MPKIFNMDNLRMIVYFSVLQIVVLNTVTASKNSPGLGHGFFIPKHDLFDDFFDGISIFETIPQKCCPVYVKSETKKVEKYFKNTTVFYHYISDTFGLSISLIGEFTMGITLSKSSSEISGRSLQTSGYSLDLYSYKDTIILTKECQISQPLSRAFLEDFNKLPSPHIEDTSGWKPYDRFLKKFGSHVVKEIQHGSRVQVFIFSEESKHYSVNQFQTRACLFAVVDGVIADLCAGYSEKEAKQAHSLKMSNEIKVRGGTYQTRSKLLSNVKNRNEELIEKLLTEGHTNPGNISYKLVPIWDILKQRRGSQKDNHFRALNLEAYYKGVLDFGCTFVTENGIKLRWMEAVNTSKGREFRCFIQPLGCRNDISCELHSEECYCKGTECVDTRRVRDRNSKIKTERFIRTSKKGESSEGINRSCKLEDSKLSCECITDWGGKPVEIWPTDHTRPSRPISGATFIGVSIIIYIPTVVSLIMMVN